MFSTKHGPTSTMVGKKQFELHTKLLMRDTEQKTSKLNTRTCSETNKKKCSRHELTDDKSPLLAQAAFYALRVPYVQEVNNTHAENG